MIAERQYWWDRGIGVAQSRRHAPFERLLHAVCLSRPRNVSSVGRLTA